MISEAYTSPLLIISKIKYSKTHFLICTAILSFSYIIHSLKIKKYTTLHYKVVYNYMERKIKRNKSDFLRSKKRKAIFFIFLFKKPKKSILELNLINHLPTITSTSSSSATWTSAIWASRTSSSTSSIWVMGTTWRNRFMVIRIYTRS